MLDCFRKPFTLRTDISACGSAIGRCDARIPDTWYQRDPTFRSGKIYGIVSEYGQGCMYVSYLLGGRIAFDGLRIFCNDTALSQDDLRAAAWNLEPYGEAYGKKQVRRSVEQALRGSGLPEDFEAIAAKFMLTPERYDRKFNMLSGERWRAAAALGYAQGKNIFFAPYKPSMFYYQMCHSGLLTVLRTLTAAGAMVILPAGSDAVIKQIADETINVNPAYHFR